MQHVGELQDVFKCSAPELLVGQAIHGDPLQHHLEDLQGGSGREEESGVRG